MKLPTLAPLFTAVVWLLFAAVVEGNIRLHAPAHLQPDHIDPRNHYYLETDSKPSPVVKENKAAAATSISSGPLPTTSTGALRCGPDFKCLDGGCCGPNSLCGFGPDYCGKGCQNGCNATAPCGKDSLNGNVACGMNLCCSYYGWCGVGPVYCTPPPKRGQPGCQTDYSDCQIKGPPQCDAGAASATKRTIAYYQGSNVYSDGRACNKVSPSDLKLDKYTHLYWAFAVIDPKTHAIVPGDVRDIFLYPAFTQLAKTNKIETWISVGGFDFVTDNPTAWSGMVATPQSRAAFIDSLVKFMSSYGFQGVDLDWEYPVDPKRGGTPNDMVNLVQLVADMRANPAFGQKYGISVTLAPDIWYLQHFDAKGLLKYSNWLGFMSYDLHGIWDADVPRVGRKVYGQTDMYDIERDLVPLWYDLSAADMSRVNFGLALYGRGYTLSDRSCNKADGSCGWIAGNHPGACTGEAGILSRAEIDLVMKSHKLAAVPLDSGHGNSMMKQITWDDQWIGFDDDETIQQKVEYASSHCFGGTMAWSIDLGTTFGESDDPGTPSSGGSPAKSAGEDCRWTDCAFPPTCGTGEVKVTERLSDSCPFQDPAETQAFCCPDPTPLHNCVWRGDPGECDGNGNCDDCKNTQCQADEELVLGDEHGDESWQCPPIGGHPLGPRRSLCCHYTDPTVGSAHSFIKAPTCDLEGSGSDTDSCQEYALSLLRESTEGACQNSHPGSDGCTSYNYQGCNIEVCGASKGTTYQCEMVGLALQELVSNCSRSTGHIGGSVLLRASGSDGTSDQTVRILNYQSKKRSQDGLSHDDARALEQLGSDLQTRSLLSRGVINRRQLSFPPNWTIADDFPYQLSFAGKMGTSNAVIDQDDVETEKAILVAKAASNEGRQSLVYTNVPLGGKRSIRLTFALKHDFGLQTFPNGQLETLVQAVNDYRNAEGNPSVFGVLLTRKPGDRTEDFLGTITSQEDDDTEEVDEPPGPLPKCGADLCALGTITCDEDPANSDFVPGQPGGRRRRDDLSVLHSEPINVTSERTPSLGKRIPFRPGGGRRPFSFYCKKPGGDFDVLEYESLRYPGINDWTLGDVRYTKAYDADDWTVCTSMEVTGHQFPTGREYVTEHVVELQTMQKFFDDISDHTLPDGNDAPGSQINCDFLQALLDPILIGTNPPLPVGSIDQENTPIVRILQVQGSISNYGGFVFLESAINQYKAQFWKSYDPITAVKLRRKQADLTAFNELIVDIRTTFNVFNYLKVQEVHDTLIRHCNQIRAELDLANNAWMGQGHPDSGILAYWDAWIRSFLGQYQLRGQRWAHANIQALTNIWGPQPASPERSLVIAAMSQFAPKILTDLTIDISRLH